MNESLEQKSITQENRLKVDVGDHCNASWCIFIFKSKVIQRERIY